MFVPLIWQSHIHVPCPVTEVLYTLLQRSIGQFAGLSDLGDFIHVGSKKLHLWTEGSRAIRQLTCKLCHQRVDYRQHTNCAVNVQTVINTQTVPSTCRLPSTYKLCHLHANHVITARPEDLYQRCFYKAHLNFCNCAWSTRLYQTFSQWNVPTLNSLARAHVNTTVCGKWESHSQVTPFANAQLSTKVTDMLGLPAV